MGTWNFGYDSLNRLTTAQNTAASSETPQYANNYGCWSYDSFGNRTAQAISTTACPAQPSALAPTASYNSSNRVTWTSVNAAGSNFNYDAAGDVTNDNSHSYLYDGEGRICAVYNSRVGGISTMTGYLYDADGTRVAKGTITAWSCDPTINGFQTTNDYVLGPGGEQVTEMGVDQTAGSSSTTLVWQHTNVYAGGALIATYDGALSTGATAANNYTPNTYGLHFYLNDPLGTRRAQTDYAGVLEQTCQSLPFGDGLNCSGSTIAPTEHHFTGKERDAESGNDYFEARYYASSMGRFMSPDPTPLGIALGDPQSWNLYSYARNRPTTAIDVGGAWYGRMVMLNSGVNNAVFYLTMTPRAIH
jgi:RHS repeat-associated protein